MSDTEDNGVPEKQIDQKIVKFIFDLSKEMNIEDTRGVVGNELELIALVRNCRFLYDKNLSDFKDVRKKNVAWGAIASVMHSTVHEVQQRWRSLREGYNKYKKEVECMEEISSGTVRPWEFYEDMKFIDPYIVHRRTSSLNFPVETESLKNEISDATNGDRNPDIVRLIAYIKRRPVLYDSKHPTYKSRESKIHAWNEVAQTMGATGIDWLYSFLNRQKDLALRKPESTSLSRAMAFNKPVVDNFFEKYAGLLEKFKFRGEQIWNLDETGITTVMKPVNMLSTKGKKQVGQIASAERGTLVTFVGIINAIGSTIPPVFVFPRVRKPAEYLTEGAPASSIALGNKSGWMTAELFPEVLKHIVNHTKCSTENMILLLVDNHESHISVESIRICKSNGIVLFSFPPHTTHRLQSLDVGVYAPFKSLLATAFNDWMLSNPGKPITIRNIGHLSKAAFEGSFSIRNIRRAFMTTGLWPINRLTFTEDDFIASSVTDRRLLPENSTNNESLNDEQPSTSGIQSSISCEPPLSSQAQNLESIETAAYESQASVISGKESFPSEAQSDKPSTSFAQPNIEELFPYPKVHEKGKRTGKRKSKSTVYTDTPELLLRENIEPERKRKQAVKKG